MTETALHRIYRPTGFDEVLGHNVVIRALEDIIDKRKQQLIIFTGPAGVGKTSLARIVAHGFGCTPNDIVERDAADKNGVDDMREIVGMLRGLPFGKSRYRAVILDECHKLSESAWTILLKPTEEPAEHVLWYFCTTDLRKVPETIRTRAKIFTLKPLKNDLVKDIVTNVANQERERDKKKTTYKFDAQMLDIIVSEANGSPRNAITLLEKCCTARNAREVRELLGLVSDTETVIKLARMLIDGTTWPKAMEVLNTLKDEPPDSVRIAIFNYVGGWARNAKSNDQAYALLAIMEPFELPYQYGGWGALTLAIGRVVVHPPASSK